MQKDAELIAFAVELYSTLGSGTKVARRLGLAVPTVYAMLADAGVPGVTRMAAAKRRAKFSGEVAAQVVAAYAAGDKMKDICARFDCGQVAVYTALKSAGVERRWRGQQPRRLSDADVAEMVRLSAGLGWQQSQIAAKFNCGVWLVSKALVGAGVRDKSKASGAAHGSWKGGKTVTPLGYVLAHVPHDHPMAVMRKASGYVPEHRLVMAMGLGRPLRQTETVHHINGNRQDNRLVNLQIRQGRHGKGVRMHCADCGSHNIEAVEI